MCKLVISKHFSKWNRKNALVQEWNLFWEGWGSSQNNSDSWEASCWTCFNLNTYPSQTEMIDSIFFLNRILALKPFSLLKKASKAQIKARPQCQRPEFPPPTPDVPSTPFQTPSSASQGAVTPQLSGRLTQSTPSAGLGPLWVQRLEEGRQAQAVRQAQTPAALGPARTRSPGGAGAELRTARQQPLLRRCFPPSPSGWAKTTHKARGSAPGQRTEEIQSELGFPRGHWGYQLILINT